MQSQSQQLHQPLRKIHTLVANGRQYQCRLLEALIIFYDGGRVVSRSLIKRCLHALTDCVTQGYTHSELAFRVSVEPPLPSGRREATIGCSIEFGQHLSMDMRSYESTLWRFFPLDLTQLQIENLFEVCMSDVEAGVSFNTLGFVWNFVCPIRALRVDGGGSQVFCSEHALRALRRAQVVAFNDLKPYETHPHRLYAYMEAHGMLNQRAPRPV
jgi:hypothetical protein